MCKRYPQQKGYDMSIVIDTENMTATVTHKTRCADTEAHLKGEENKAPTFTHTFDFSNVKQEQILQWLADNRIIAWRSHNNVKDLTKKEVRALPSTIDVAVDFAKKARGGKTALVKSIETLAESAGMTVEEFILDLQSKQVKV